MSTEYTPPLALNEGAVRRALGDPDTPGFVLLTIALHTFGPDLFGDKESGIDALDPAEIWAGLHAKYGTWVPEEGENKLNAIIVGVIGGAFWVDLEVFQAVSTALFDGDLGDIIDVGFEDLSATELMWAMLEMGLVWDSSENPSFSLDVQSYIDKVLAYEQEDQEQNLMQVEQAYMLMLDQLRALGVPLSVLRTLDEEYAQLAASLEASSSG